MSKISLPTQLSDARHELEQRRRCDANGIARMKMRRSEGQRALEVQQAIVQSLEFLEHYEPEIRLFIASKRGAAK